MKVSKKFLLLAVSLIVPGAQGSESSLQSLFGSKDSSSLNIVSGREKKVELESLKKDLTQLTSEEQHFWDEQNPKIDKIKADIVVTEEALKKPAAPKGFLNKKVLVLKASKQATVSIKSTWKELLLLQQQHIALLENYIKDPDFTALLSDKKTVNSIQDLEALNDQVATLDEKLVTEQSAKNETQRDLSNRKKKATATEAEYKEKVQQQVDFSSHKTNQPPLPDLLDTQQYGELLDLQVSLAYYEKELAKFRVKEEELDLAMLTTKLEITEKKLQVLKKKRNLMTRMSLRVDEKDVSLARIELTEEKKNYINATDKLTQSKEKFLDQAQKQKEKLQTLREKFKGVVDDPSLLHEWSSRPSTEVGYCGLAEIGRKEEELSLLERQVDLIDAETTLERVAFRQKELSVDIVESWYKIKHQQFKTNEDFVKALKSYETADGELERERAIYQDKRHTATGRLNMQNKALSNIPLLVQQVKGAKDTLFKGSEQKYQQCVASLEKAQGLISKQVEVTSKLIEVYSKLLVIADRSRRQVASLMTELQQVNLWHRSGRAISWQGLGNLIPDLRSFLSDVKTLGFSYLAQLTMTSVWNRILGIIRDPFSIFFLFFKMLLVLGLFFLLRRLLPLLSKTLANVNQEIQGVYLISLMSSMIVEFIYLHLAAAFIWVLLFLAFGINPSPEIPSVLFYLFSIFYLLFFSFKFTAYLAKFNEEQDHIFFSESFQARFTPFLNWFLGVTIVIFLFREAFILATYTKSELPDILLALYSIIVRVLLLSLIRKEDLLKIIPSKTKLWAAVWRFVDRYYYPVLFVLIVIMIMMDPHIGGYNNLVYYLVWGVVGTLLTIKIFYELYIFCRRFFSFLFFISDGETLSERFPYSKTLYGVSVVLLFITFGFLCFFSVAWVWGKPISFDSVVEFFTVGRLNIVNNEGQFEKVSIFDLLQMLGLIPLSLFVAFLIDRFVVHRIFSVLLVNPGVHNAISTITYYLIVICTITIGLWSQGLGFVVRYYIFPILVAMVWALRDIFNDFISYFVILIQRPIKVGDYIKIDDETRGVVRNITPRAVVLRRKQGYCLIIPNSRLMRETITNWDYHLNFITCPDILVMVPYRFNPKQIREILWNAANDTGRVLKTPSAIVRLEEFADSGFLFLVRVYISSEQTLMQWQIASDVRIAMIIALRKNKMEVAFPVRIIRTPGDKIHPEGEALYSHTDKKIPEEESK